MFFENIHKLKNLKELKIGDMIGHNFASEFTEKQEQLCTIKGKTDGIIAILPFGEIKLEIRKSPEAVSVLLLTLINSPFRSIN